MSWVIGAIALFFSWQVGQKWNAGDKEGATKASKTAQTVSIVGIVVGAIALFVLYGA